MKNIRIKKKGQSKVLILLFTVILASCIGTKKKGYTKLKVTNCLDSDVIFRKIKLSLSSKELKTTDLIRVKPYITDKASCTGLYTFDLIENRKYLNNNWISGVFAFYNDKVEVMEEINKDSCYFYFRKTFSESDLDEIKNRVKIGYQVYDYRNSVSVK